MARKLAFILLFLLASRMGICVADADVKGGDRVDKEASEMGVLAQGVQKYIDKTGRLPSNWSDIWDADAVLGAKEHDPDRTPMYDRFSFVAGNPPMLSPYDGSVAEGTILIMRNDPVDLANTNVTWKKGREWWFVWVNSKRQASGAFVSEDRLSVGAGPGKIELKKPDIPKEKLDAFVKKLTDIGYTNNGVAPDSGPSPQNPPSSSPSLQPSPATPPGPAPPQTPKPVAEVAPATDTGIPVWLYGVILLSVAIIAGGGWYLLRSKK